MTVSDHRLPLTALRTFEAAARHESFKDAAAELRVSRTTVSNQIRALERDLGVKLFVRGTRQVTLTDVGLSISRTVRSAFDAISREIGTYSQGRRSLVTMAVGPIFGSRWLTPRLGRFHRALPTIELSLQRGYRVTGPGNMPTAIAIDWGFGDWPGVDSQHLLDVTYAPILSPALARTVGRITRPTDLAGLPVIHQYDRSEFQAWLKFVGAPDVRFSGETIIEDANTVIQAAIDGQGVALGTFPFIQSEVTASRLLKPFDAEYRPARSYHILTRPGARSRPEIAAICAWLLAEAASSATSEAEAPVPPMPRRRRPSRAGG